MDYSGRHASRGPGWSARRLRELSPTQVPDLVDMALHPERYTPVHVPGIDDDTCCPMHTSEPKFTCRGCLGDM